MNFETDIKLSFFNDRSFWEVLEEPEQLGRNRDVGPAGWFFKSTLEGETRARTTRIFGELF